jgi:hypothetical protein
MKKRMMMFEMRWFQSVSGEKVLQYRNIYLIEPDRQSQTGFGFFKATDWKDVPVVKEQEKSIK